MTTSHAAKKTKSTLKFVTLDKESNMNTLWQREKFLKMCSRGEVTEKAQEIEERLPVKRHQQARFGNHPEFFFVDRF